MQGVWLNIRVANRGCWQIQAKDGLVGPKKKKESDEDIWASKFLTNKFGESLTTKREIKYIYNIWARRREGW